jgi:hypothetical protein
MIISNLLGCSHIGVTPSPCGRPFARGIANWTAIVYSWGVPATFEQYQWDLHHRRPKRLTGIVSVA